jgi:hypothetical protein
MIPPVLRPSSLPALARCPCYAPDQSEGEEQKSDGTKRHTALGKYLANDPTWRADLGSDWDAGGVEWAGEYIRMHAPSGYALDIEIPRTITLECFKTLKGTPDVTAGPVIFDLKGRDIGSYREQMAGYVLLCDWMSSPVHVLYATERRAEVFRMDREEAEQVVNTIAEAVTDTERTPNVCDYCGWCANRPVCPAFNATGRSAATALGLSVPTGNIEDITDSDGLRDLKIAAEAVAEWAKSANQHVREMAFERGVVPTGYRIGQRKGAAKIEDTWGALSAAGIAPERAASKLAIKFGDLVELYAADHDLKEKAARTDLEARLGPILQRGATIQTLIDR